MHTVCGYDDRNCFLKMLDCLFNVAEKTLPEPPKLLSLSSSCILEHADATTEILRVLAPPLSQCVVF